MDLNNDIETWVTHSPSRTKKKYWILESRWLSKDDYEKYVPYFFRNNKGYTTEWCNSYRFATKFKTSQGVKDHFASLKKNDENKNVLFSPFTLGREWRIRNIISGEIININS